MALETLSLHERLDLLGLHGGEVPLDDLESRTAALSCFPMYMVANIHAWTSDRQFHLPIVDLPGSEEILEAFAIGRQEAALELTREDRRLLGSLLTSHKPSDRVIYEFALETLRMFLDAASPDMALAVRVAVAQMVVAVARAAGKGPLGSGRKVTPDEHACIRHIDEVLALRQAEPAAAVLMTLDDY